MFNKKKYMKEYMKEYTKLHYKFDPDMHKKTTNKYRENINSKQKTEYYKESTLFTFKKKKLVYLILKLQEELKQEK